MKRILFAMGYPGYLRYFDSTVKRLCERGHEVVVVFEQPKKQEEGLKGLSGTGSRVVIKSFPPRSLLWDLGPRDLRHVTDWVRYLDPAFADASYLRRRSAERLPKPFKPLARVSQLGRRPTRALLHLLLATERAVPAYRAVRQFMLEQAPDVVVVTPLVTSASRLADIVRAAQAESIPTVLPVASWDHLTSKGVIRIQPDRVIVWNEIQAEEARTLHEVPPEKIVVTGAQPWDRWFDYQPSTSARAFRERVGLPAERPFVLFVGSTASISAPRAELEFVRDWISSLRASDNPAIRDLGVLVRPHPFNTFEWETADLDDLGAAAIWPRSGHNPTDDGDRADYFDSLYHATAVVGINTSAMMEAAIVGRPVFTIRSHLFEDSQAGTLHFKYLLPDNGGFVEVADSLDEHLAQLGEVLRDPESRAARIEGFVARFIRPHGVTRPALPLVADVIEELAYAPRPAAHRMPLRLAPLRTLLAAYSFLRIFTSARHYGRLLVAVAPAIGDAVALVASPLALLGRPQDARRVGSAATERLRHLGKATAGRAQARAQERKQLDRMTVALPPELRARERALMEDAKT